MKWKIKLITLNGFDLIYKALVSKAAHTSLGNLPLSNEKASSNFWFVTKSDGDYIFVFEELASNLNWGKYSPKPVY